ncbi:MAG: cupin domain-containing protein [Bacteroidia bacterium]|nr:cupin domain-containing protein [Bacteroidia bacterium]
METKVDLAAKLAQLSGYWQPGIVARFNGQELKVVQFVGEFVWHSHPDTDELFWVLEGEFDLQFRDRTETLRAGECIVVPKGVEHCPKATQVCKIALIETAGTLNTGDAPESVFTHEAQAL